MIEKISALILLTVLPVMVSVAAGPWPAKVEARQGRAATTVSADYLSPQPSVETLTRFSEEEVSVSTPIPFATEYIDDPELEIGTEKVLQQGANGQRTETYLVKYWSGEEMERSLVEVQVTEPQKQVVSRGTKIIWGRTFSGTPVTYGTLAVDPSVIPLGTRVYIPGYGIGKAEDIGGGVKGNKIDLGFEDVAKGWWQVRWTEVYLLE